MHHGGLQDKVMKRYAQQRSLQGGGRAPAAQSSRPRAAGPGADLGLSSPSASSSASAASSEEDEGGGRYSGHHRYPMPPARAAYAQQYLARPVAQAANSALGARGGRALQYEDGPEESGDDDDSDEDYRHYAAEPFGDGSFAWPPEQTVLTGDPEHRGRSTKARTPPSSDSASSDEASDDGCGAAAPRPMLRAPMPPPGAPPAVPNHGPSLAHGVFWEAYKSPAANFPASHAQPAPPPPPPPLHHPQAPRSHRGGRQGGAPSASPAPARPPGSRRRANVPGSGVGGGEGNGGSSGSRQTSRCRGWDEEEARPEGSAFDFKLWWEGIYQNCGRRAVLKCIRRRRHAVRIALGLLLALHVVGLLWISRTVVTENTSGVPVSPGPQQDAFLAKLSPQARRAAGLKPLPSTSPAPRHGWLPDWAGASTPSPSLAQPVEGWVVASQAKEREDAFMVPKREELPRLPPHLERAAAAAEASAIPAYAQAGHVFLDPPVPNVAWPSAAKALATAGSQVQPQWGPTANGAIGAGASAFVGVPPAGFAAPEAAGAVVQQPGVQQPGLQEASWPGAGVVGAGAVGAVVEQPAGAGAQLPHVAVPSSAGQPAADPMAALQFGLR